MVREGSAPNFCPPVTEGMTVELADENGDGVELEYLGCILHNGCSYGFFFPVSEDNPAGSSGEVVILEVVEEDDEGQPTAFELLTDEAIAAEIYADFREATKDIYRFE